VRGRILIVDDEPSIREIFQLNLSQGGHEVQTAGSAEEALARVEEFQPDVVVTDVRMDGMSGLELLKRLRAADPEAAVLVMTAHEDMQSAVSAMKEGALDYLVKPVDLEALELHLDRALRDRALGARARRQGEEVADRDSVEKLVGRDPAMIEIFKMIGVLAGNRATVLVRGETGTGKERVARAIHAASAQSQEPFLSVNCTALSDHLLESELFGHVRGSFTGAVANRKGFFELAGSGTVFLDEIGDTSLDFQAKLLRVLQDGEYRPVGGEQIRHAEARVIAATHRPLEEWVESGRFREDLYFRLRVVEIVVPPLRERREDIPLLVEHFLERIPHRLHQPAGAIAPEAVRLLGSYSWPGNVRELENVLTRAVVLARGGVIREEHVGLFPAPPAEPEPDSADQDTLAAAEARHVQQVLDRCGGNKRKTARTLGITRPRLERIIERHGLVVHRGDE
jgi:DNA-binding NtrC family response regulator